MKISYLFSAFNDLKGSLLFLSVVCCCCLLCFSKYSFIVLRLKPFSSLSVFPRFSPNLFLLKKDKKCKAFYDRVYRATAQVCLTWRYAYSENVQFVARWKSRDLLKRSDSEPSTMLRMLRQISYLTREKIRKTLIIPQSVPRSFQKYSTWIRQQEKNK